jgi:hypothetical protein
VSSSLESQSTTSTTFRYHLLIASKPSSHTMLLKNINSLMSHIIYMMMTEQMKECLKQKISQSKSDSLHMQKAPHLHRLQLLCHTACKISGIFVSVMYQALYYTNILISNQIITPHAVLPAFRSSKYSSYSIQQKAKLHVNLNGFTLIFVVLTQHQKESQFMSLYSSMNLHTGVRTATIQDKSSSTVCQEYHHLIK